MFEVTGKRALVTDGSAGIGLGMARGLARADADVALWGRDPGRLETAASGLAKFAESTTEDHRKAMGTNLDGGYFTLRETTKTLVAQGTGGSVIVTSSLGAHEGAGRNQAYGASKAGVLALANGCAVELARYGIRVNSVLPGWVATDMTGPLRHSEIFNSHVISRVPLGRWATPEDFEGIAVYLASDASAFRTGSSTLIDGGYSIF